MQYVVESTNPMTDKVSYITITGHHGYSLTDNVRNQTLFDTREIADRVYFEFVALYPNTSYRETKVRCYGSTRDEYVEGMKFRYGNVSK